MMKALLLLLSLGFTQQTFNPSGLWEVVDKDTQYRLTRTGTGIHVSLGADRAQFVEYEVDLSWTELNSYQGSGYFVARLGDGRECRFETQWRLVVANARRIVGVTSSIVPEEEGCGVAERAESSLQLNRIRR